MADELAGGSGAIVARARTRFESGDREAALHLLDILFSQENPGEDAIALAIEVHESLLGESRNFWLTAWLRNQINRLGAKR